MLRKSQPPPVAQYICISRTVSSQDRLSALLNWFKLVYGLVGQSNLLRTLDFCPDQLRGNRIYQRAYFPNIYCVLQPASHTHSTCVSKLQWVMCRLHNLKIPNWARLYCQIESHIFMLGHMLLSLLRKLDCKLQFASSTETAQYIQLVYISFVSYM